MARGAWWWILALGLLAAGCAQQTAVAVPPAVVTEVAMPTPTVVAPPPTLAERAPQQALFTAGTRQLAIEVLDDGMIHFGWGEGTAAVKAADLLTTTPMVAQTVYSGPTAYRDDGRGLLETASLRVTVDPERLCLTITDTVAGRTLTTFCPEEWDGSVAALSLTPETTQHLYGLGEHFLKAGEPNGDWLGEKVTTGNPYGNAMVYFNRGNVGNAQFPVLYALGEGGENYALFLDHIYPQTWDFMGTPWRLETRGTPIRGYFMTGPDLPSLRQDYMELVGRPPVPPKKMFGLWVSEYGFDNWGELEDKLQTLREAHFPVDGFVMDLQWFGGVGGESHMGAVSWDETNFPDPVGTLARLRDEEGVGLMLMEESYVSRSRPEFKELESRGYLARDGGETGKALVMHGWWGYGGMLDWSAAEAGDYWHDLKRQPLIEMGILGHWTDLGEPELFLPKKAWYAGFGMGHVQYDVHNLYNFAWAESIARGYERNQVEQRPFILSRSGTSGMQRFGAAMWSGDIGSNLGSLAAHQNAQLHMSLSGMDYFGTDIGGFDRTAVDGDAEAMYTHWLANEALFDTPVRVHTSNRCNCYETAPDRIGDEASNLENVRLRYRLIPYLYSLAHRAYLYGEPVVPPLVYYYQNDPQVAVLGDEKLLGRDLLAATVLTYGMTARDVYLPAGSWADYYTDGWIESRGETVPEVATLDAAGRLRLPLYVRGGAIVPEMYVDEQTMDATGRRLDGSRRDELRLRVYADGKTPGQFTLYEDDGATVAYQRGAVRTTEIRLEQEGQRVLVIVEPTKGSYAGAVEERETWIRLVLRQGTARQVLVNGQRIAFRADAAEWEIQPAGWYEEKPGVIWVKTGVTYVHLRQLVEVVLGGK